MFQFILVCQIFHYWSATIENYLATVNNNTRAGEILWLFIAQCMLPDHDVDNRNKLSNTTDITSTETTVQANHIHKTESIKRTQKTWQHPTPELSILFVFFFIFFWSVTIFILPDSKHLHVILFDNNAVPRFRMDAHSHLFYSRFYSLRSRVNSDYIILFFLCWIWFVFVAFFDSHSASG